MEFVPELTPDQQEIETLAHLLGPTKIKLLVGQFFDQALEVFEHTPDLTEDMLKVTKAIVNQMKDDFVVHMTHVEQSIAAVEAASVEDLHRVTT